MSILQEHLREVVLLCSSSRGGSSISTEWLRQHTGLLQLRAEINPLLHMSALVYPHANTSDLLSDLDQQNNETCCGKNSEVGSYHTEALDEQDWTFP